MPVNPSYRLVEDVDSEKADHRPPSPNPPPYHAPDDEVDHDVRRYAKEETNYKYHLGLFLVLLCFKVVIVLLVYILVLEYTSMGMHHLQHVNHGHQYFRGLQHTAPWSAHHPHLVWPHRPLKWHAHRLYHVAHPPAAPMPQAIHRVQLVQPVRTVPGHHGVRFHFRFAVPARFRISQLVAQAGARGHPGAEKTKNATEQRSHEHEQPPKPKPQH